MFAAAPCRSQALETVRLALSLIAKHQSVPGPLKQHFEIIVSQAKRLAEDPTGEDTDVLPESIELAVEFQSDDDVFRDFEDVTAFDSISPEVAQHILSAMAEHQPCL